MRDPKLNFVVNKDMKTLGFKIRTTNNFVVHIVHLAFFRMKILEKFNGK